jgi:hypothetical protein
MNDQPALGPDVVDAPTDGDLGPFSPPRDFDHGPEFEPAAPRPIPGRLRRGLYGRKQWAAVITLAVLATGCIFMAPWQITQDIALTILPLAYLDWIGYALFAIAVIVAVKNRTSMERYGYVRDGVPIAGRVLEARPTVVQSINPQTKAVIERTHYLVNVEYDDPQTRKHETASVLSEEN